MQEKEIRKEKNTSESRALEEILQNRVDTTANYTFIHKKKHVAIKLLKKQ